MTITVDTNTKTVTVDRGRETLEAFVDDVTVYVVVERHAGERATVLVPKEDFIQWIEQVRKLL